jgi:SAM-dependent methyltransferase
MARRAQYWERSVPWLFKEEGLTYEARRKLRYSLQDYMQEVIPFDLHGSELVLEIGSGGGIDSAEFARNGAQVVSLDFTEAGARATRDTLKEAGVTSHVIRASAESLPFRESCFDCVYSFGVIHHIPGVADVVDEIGRALKAGGELVCMIYNRRSLLYAYSILFLHRGEGNEEELLRMYSERNLNCPYTRAYTKEEACNLFARDFDVSASVHFNVVDVPQRRKLKLEIPDGYELGWHIVVR